MNGYKITDEQSNQLRNQLFNNDSYFNPIKDINGEYFISYEEVEFCNNKNFMWVKNLTMSEYVTNSNFSFLIK